MVAAHRAGRHRPGRRHERVADVRARAHRPADRRAARRRHRMGETRAAGALQGGRPDRRARHADGRLRRRLRRCRSSSRRSSKARSWPSTTARDRFARWSAASASIAASSIAPHRLAGRWVRCSSPSSTPPPSIAGTRRLRSSSTNRSAYEPGPGQPPYQPRNYDGKYEGNVTLRHALEDSRNVPAVKMMDALTPQQVIAYARRFGLESKLEPYPVARARRRRPDAPRHDVRLFGVSERRRAHAAVFDPEDLRSRRQSAGREPARSAGCDQRRHGVRDDEPAARRRAARNGGVGQQAGLAARRQDRHDRRLRRRVVHRLRSGHHRRRLGGPRRAEADWPQRDGRRRRAADLDRLHARLHRDARSEEPARIHAARQHRLSAGQRGSGEVAEEGATGINEAFISGTQPGTAFPH